MPESNIPSSKKSPVNYNMIIAGLTVALAVFLLLRHINELSDTVLSQSRQIHQLEDACLTKKFIEPNASIPAYNH